ncbi:alpha/beta fold hydrolase [Paenibacillus sp. FSL R7-0331]|uniref:alpha/beta fold hydrolase n=1 Tax=Paenibacillus sp. FSL R7-0331 TaxID=1536773 RepID=UPI0006947AD9|nr:alpha/beta hydrolase [Paenibacillus sp. FSL R7-0331]
MPATHEHTFGNSHYIQTPDGRKLHYMVKGDGPVTVVFESGMGMSRSCWGLVQPPAAEHTRSVVYDRAGSGKSEPDSAPRTLARIAGDLVFLIRQLGSGPFILVGHSWGGPIVRTVAALLGSSQIRGILLVDPTDENCNLYFEEATAKHYGRMDYIIPFMMRTGLYKLIGSRPGKVQPADVYADHKREDFTMQAAKTMLAEGRNFLQDLKTLHDRPVQLGTIPLTLISGTQLSRMEKKTRPVLHAAHRKTAEAHPDSRLVEAPQSGHMIMYTEPQLIVDEIKRMLP